MKGKKLIIINNDYCNKVITTQKHRLFIFKLFDIMNLLIDLTLLYDLYIRSNTELS